MPTLFETLNANLMRKIMQLLPLLSIKALTETSLTLYGACIHVLESFHPLTFFCHETNGTNSIHSLFLKGSNSEVELNGFLSPSIEEAAEALCRLVCCNKFITSIRAKNIVLMGNSFGKALKTNGIIKSIIFDDNSNVASVAAASIFEAVASSKSLNIIGLEGFFGDYETAFDLEMAMKNMEELHLVSPNIGSDILGAIGEFGTNRLKNLTIRKPYEISVNPIHVSLCQTVSLAKSVAKWNSLTDIELSCFKGEMSIDIPSITLLFKLDSISKLSLQGLKVYESGDYMDQKDSVFLEEHKLSIISTKASVINIARCSFKVHRQGKEYLQHFLECVLKNARISTITFDNMDAEAFVENVIAFFKIGSKLSKLSFKSKISANRRLRLKEAKRSSGSTLLIEFDPPFDGDVMYPCQI